MSHQDSGPRNYVHQKFHEQTIEQKDKRIRELEAEFQTILDDPAIGPQSARKIARRALSKSDAKVDA